MDLWEHDSPFRVLSAAAGVLDDLVTEPFVGWDETAFLRVVAQCCDQETATLNRVFDSCRVTISGSPSCGRISDYTRTLEEAQAFVRQAMLVSLLAAMELPVAVIEDKIVDLAHRREAYAISRSHGLRQRSTA